MLRLQHAIGNGAVTQMLRTPAIFDTRTAVESAVKSHPELVAPKGPSAPGAEHSNRSDATSFDAQPDALREVMERSFPENARSWFSRALSDDDRQALVQIYNRMVGLGLWGHVRVIIGIDPAEDPVRIGPIELGVRVPGRSASVRFEVYDRKALLDSMLVGDRDPVAGQGPVFGADQGPSGALHPGQTSMREFTTKTRNGLHLSIGKTSSADAHLDKVSPTVEPVGGVSQMDLVRSLEHHWQEVWPEFLRAGQGWVTKIPRGVYRWLIDKSAHLGLGKAFREALKAIPESLFKAAAFAVGLTDAVWAGTTFKPADKIEHPDPSQREKGTDFVTVKEYRFGGGGRKGDRGWKPVKEAGLGASIDERVARAVESIDPGVIKASAWPAGDDYAEAVATGVGIARKALYAAKAKQTAIGLDLGALYERAEPRQIAELKSQLSRIGKTACDELRAALTEDGQESLATALAAVRSCTVQLGQVLTAFPLQ